MKTIVILKVSVGIVLAISSSLVTSSILAQAAKRKPSIKQAKAQTTKPAVALEDPNSPLPRAKLTYAATRPLNNFAQPNIQAIQVDDLTTSRFTLRKMQLQAIDGGVIIRSVVSIHDSRNGFNYMWHLKVKDEITNTVVFLHAYEDKLFTNQGKMAGNAEFQDVLELPPGKYKIYLQLFDIPVGIPAMKLRDPKIAEEYVVVRGIDRLEL